MHQNNDKYNNNDNNNDNDNNGNNNGNNNNDNDDDDNALPSSQSLSLLFISNGGEASAHFSPLFASYTDHLVHTTPRRTSSDPPGSAQCDSTVMSRNFDLWALFAHWNHK